MRRRRSALLALALAGASGPSRPAEAREAPDAANAQTAPDAANAQTAPDAANTQTTPDAANAQTAAKSTTVMIEGELHRAGDRAPLVGVPVLVYPAASDAAIGSVRDPAPPDAPPPWLRRVLTDERGGFAIDALPPGRVAVEVMTAGYPRSRWIVDVPGRGRPLRLFLRPDDRSVYRTTVAEQRLLITPAAAPSPARRVLSREEIRTLPGSQGDPLRAIQSLPGVARAPFGLGLLVLRGAGPRLSQVYVGDHPVPLAFHLSGLSTVVSGDVVDDLAFMPSNFAPAYGNASGGLITITPRVGRRDAYHGDAYLDFGNVGAVAEGPVGKGSFLIAARRAHLDLPLRVAAAVNPYGLTLLPTYYDSQIFYDRPLRRRQHLHVGFLASADRLSYQSTADADGKREVIFEPRVAFYRVDLAYRGQVGATSFLLTPAFRIDNNRILSDTGGPLPDPRRSYVTTLRAQIDHRVTEHFAVVLGADADLGAQTGETAMRPYYGSITNSNTTTLTHDYFGLYGEAILRGHGLTLAAGSRLAAFIADKGRGFAADPRIRGRAELGERVALSAAAGLYSQPWIGQQKADSLLAGGVGNFVTGHLLLPDQILDNFDPTLAYSERGLRVLHAVQASAGVAVRLEREVDLEVTGFFRDLRDPGVQPLEVPAGGRAYGGEFLLRKRLVRRLYGWIAYTLMWAKSEHINGDVRTFAVSPYDQRHNLVAVLSLRLPRDWQIGGRFRLSSGLPYTPQNGAIGLGDGYQPLAGPLLSERFPVFHQLDLRVDKRWLLRRALVIAYLDVLNAYNYANTEAYIYTTDYQRKVGGLGLPILPLFGVRVEI